MTTRTVLGALTNVFNPHSSCATPVIGPYDLHAANYGSTCSQMGSNPITVVGEDCFPLSFGSYVQSQDKFNTIPVFSPGDSCPQGWVTACSFTSAAREILDTLPAGEKNIMSILSPHEAVTGCCPSGYECDLTLGLHCVTHASPGKVVTGTSYTEGCSPVEATTTMTSAATTAAIGTAYRVNLVNIATETPDSDSGGLSTDAKIAVGVSIPVGVLLILGTVLFFFWRERRAKTTKIGASSNPQLNGPENPESTAPADARYASGIGGGTLKPELEDRQAPPQASQSAELDDTEKSYAELDSSATASYELDGNSRYR